MKIKGVNLKNQVRYIREFYGERGLRKVLTALSKEDREFIMSPDLLPSHWVPLEVSANCHWAVVNELNNGDESIIIEMNEYATGINLGGVYKAFLRAFISPHMMMKMAPRIVSTFLEPIGTRCTKLEWDRSNCFTLLKIKRYPMVALKYSESCRKTPFAMDTGQRTICKANPSIFDRSR